MAASEGLLARAAEAGMHIPGKKVVELVGGGGRRKGEGEEEVVIGGGNFLPCVQETQQDGDSVA